MKSLNKKDEKNELKEVKIIKEEIKRVNDNLDNIYLDKLNNKVTLEQFDRLSTKLNNELKLKTKRLIELTNIINNQKNNDINSKLVEEYINKFLSIENFGRELIVNLIDRIEIFEDKTINIKVTFNK